MLKSFAEFLSYNLFQISKGSLIGEAVSFFIYDTIKILLLLIIIIFVVSAIRSYLPTARIRDTLSKKSRIFGYIFSALFGIVTPFCTCSAIPLFLGFLEAGIPLGITFTFLVASPMINEVALVLLFGLFGWKIALLYIGSGLIIAILAGILIDIFELDNLVLPYANDRKLSTALGTQMKFNKRLVYAKNYTKNIVKKVYPYILIGVALGAFIHGYIPTDFMARYASADKWYAVPLAVILGVPLYSNAAGVIPLVSALTEKGVAMGTTLAFMMAVTGLSLPEFLILKKVMKIKLLAIFAGIVTLGIIATGYLFNSIL